MLHQGGARPGPAGRRDGGAAPAIPRLSSTSRHSWLTASSARFRYAAAVASALLATFAYAMHSRGLVMLADLAVVGVLIFRRQAAARLSVLAAAVTTVVTGAAAGLLGPAAGAGPGRRAGDAGR